MSWSDEELEQLAAAEAAAGREQPRELAGLPSVDLRTLLGEMTALKTELRKETQATRELRAGVDDGLRQMRTALAAAKSRDSDRAAGRDETCRALIDVVDRLQPAVTQAAALAGRRGRWFRRRDPAMEALAEGLQLTLDGVLADLEARGVERIDTTGASFDPLVMAAVDVTARADLPDGAVTEEISSGWRDLQGAVLRPAQVVVNKRRDDSKGKT